MGLSTRRTSQEGPDRNNWSEKRFPPFTNPDSPVCVGDPQFTPTVGMPRNINERVVFLIMWTDLNEQYVNLPNQVFRFEISKPGKNPDLKSVPRPHEASHRREISPPVEERSVPRVLIWVPFPIGWDRPRSVPVDPAHGSALSEIVHSESNVRKIYFQTRIHAPSPVSGSANDWSLWTFSSSLWSFRVCIQSDDKKSA